MRIIKKRVIYKNPTEKHENHEKQRMSCENIENHEKS